MKIASLCFCRRSPIFEITNNWLLQYFYCDVNETSGSRVNSTLVMIQSRMGMFSFLLNTFSVICNKTLYLTIHGLRFSVSQCLYYVLHWFYARYNNVVCETLKSSVSSSKEILIEFLSQNLEKPTLEFENNYMSPKCFNEQNNSIWDIKVARFIAQTNFSFLFRENTQLQRLWIIRKQKVLRDV